MAGLILNAALDAAVDRSVADLMGRADVRVAAFEEQGLSPDERRRPSPRPRASPTVAPTLERRTYPLAERSLRGAARAPHRGRHRAGGRPRGPRPAASRRARRWAPATTTGRSSRPSWPARTGSASAPRSRCSAIRPCRPTVFRVVGVLAPTPGDPDPAGRTVVVPSRPRSALFATDRVTAVDVLARRRDGHGRRDRRARAAPDGRAVHAEHARRPRRRARGGHRRDPGDDRARGGRGPVRGRVPHLQHAVDDGRRAGPRRGAAAGRRHDPPAGDPDGADLGRLPRRRRRGPRRPGRHRPRGGGGGAPGGRGHRGARRADAAAGRPRSSAPSSGSS